MRRKKKQIRVTEGNVSVTIYRVKNRKKPLFQICDYTSGRRKLISCAEEKIARKKARKIAIDLANGETAVFKMSAKDRAVYVRAVQLLKPSKKPLELAAARRTN